MSACRITRGRSTRGGYRGGCAPSRKRNPPRMAEPTPAAATASIVPPAAAPERGPAAGVRWGLSDLYAGPEDPRLEADLDAAEARAKRFAERYRGRMAA